jgi:hypothetical protein
MVKRTEKPTNSDATPLQRVTLMLSSALDGLEEYLEEATPKLKNATAEQAGEFVHVLTKIAHVGSELRKAEKADRDANSETTLKHVGEFIRRASDAELKQVTRMLRDIETSKGRSGLA